MKVSDEIRNWCEFEDGTECGGFVTKASFDKLCALADRIEEELVELPKGMDGVPIHVGDTVYLDDGHMAKVVRIELMQNESCIDCWVGGGKSVGYLPSGISHTRPDSWERIANELEGLSVDSSDNYYVSTHCSKLADRIRKLAEKDGEQ